MFTHRLIIHVLPLAVVGAIAGCDLQPAPKPAAPATAAAAANATGTASGSGAADAAVAPNAVDVTPGCLNVATHVVQVLIDSAKDPSLRSTYTQAQTKMVRTMGEACTTQHWSDAAQHCYLASTTETDARVCERKFAPPPTGSPPQKDN